MVSSYCISCSPSSLTTWLQNARTPSRIAAASLRAGSTASRRMSSTCPVTRGDDLCEQLVLVPECVVEGAQGRAGFLGDPAGGGALQALPGRNLDRRLHELLPACLCADSGQGDQPPLR